ncbi:hypothetical protein KIN20_017069 [Parelaphostrongylus tenuis]|uniref:Uncharacterized protein n=1 Tax=Parelaphostrongylus tenuis TaxID=148309 RepID=A0AAD5N0E3_PARTN|nr:hypothetical protein KIN20_017069 [Parelaphostrongylus tenuis]
MSSSDRFPRPSEKREAYTLVVECICCIAFGMNLLLIYVFLRCRLRTVVTYKFFFILTTAQNIVSSIFFFVTAPRAICFDFTFLFVGTGLLAGTPAGPYSLLIYSAVFVSSILLATNNFLYKYFQLCKPLSIHIYTPKWIIVIIAINIALVVNWLSMNILCGWPSKEFIYMVREYTSTSYQYELINSTFMGISMKHISKPSKFALLIESLIMVLGLGLISLLFAIKIHFYLKHNSMSTQTKQMHRKTLKLLSLQTACPFLLLHVPLYTMYMLLFTGITSSKLVGDTIGTLMSLFPLISPLLTIIFTEDYRKGYSPVAQGQVDNAVVSNTNNAYNAGLATELYMTPQTRSEKTGAQQLAEMYISLKNLGIKILTVWIQVCSM